MPKKCNHIVAIERIDPEGKFYVYHNSSRKISSNAEIFNFCPKCGEPIKRKKGWLGKEVV